MVGEMVDYTTDRPDGVPFAVGDEVCFVNDYGNRFGPYTVLGYPVECRQPGVPLVALAEPWSTPWFQPEASSLRSFWESFSAYVVRHAAIEDSGADNDLRDALEALRTSPASSGEYRKLASQWCVRSSDESDVFAMAAVLMTFDSSRSAFECVQLAKAFHGEGFTMGPESSPNSIQPWLFIFSDVDADDVLAKAKTARAAITSPWFLDWFENRAEISD